MNNWPRLRCTIVLVSTFFLCTLAHAGKLHDAINNNEIEKAVALIKKRKERANLLNKRINGLAPIHLAAEKGFLSVVRELVLHGANIALPTDMGYSAIHLALINGFDDIVEFLQEKDAKIESELLFKKLATKHKSRRYDTHKEQVKDIEIRDLLLIESCYNVFMYAYPLVINRKKLFEKINEFIMVDKQFLEQIRQEQTVSRINDEQFIKKIRSQRFHSVRAYIEKEDSNTTEAGDLRKSKDSYRDIIDSKNVSHESLSKSKDAISRHASTDSFSPGELRRKKITSQTSSHEENNSKKISAASMSISEDSKEEFDREQTPTTIEREEIISVEELLSPANGISLDDIKTLKDRLVDHKCIPPDFIHVMLYGFASEGFPAGGHSEVELKRLALFLDKTNASHRLRRKIWSSLYAKKQKNEEQDQKNKAGKLPTFNKEKIAKEIILPQLKELWTQLSTEELAVVFTKIDAALFRNISLDNLYSHIVGNTPVSVKRCIDHTNVRVNFFSYLIVSENDKDKRLKIAKKLLKLGEKFKNKNNFWGLAQVSMALGKTDVESLISWKDAKDLYKIHVKLQNIFSPFDNYGSYHKALKKIPIDAPCLPHIAIVLHDFEMLREMQMLTPNGFIFMGNALKHFMKFVELSSRYEFDRTNIEPFNKIPLLKEDVITEFSIAQKTIPIIRSMPIEPLNEWQCSQLASCLYEENNYKIVLNTIQHYIWSGEDVINFLSTGRQKDKFMKLDRLGIDNVTKCFLVSEVMKIYENRQKKISSRRATDNTRSMHRVSANKTP